MLAILTGKLGYTVVRQRGSHRQMRSEAGYPPLTFSFGENETLGPTMVKKILVQGVGLTEEAAREVL